MTLTLPDDPALAGMTESEIRLDLACAFFSAGRISRTVAAGMSGLGRMEFDVELRRRSIPSATEETLAEDLVGLRSLFQQ